MQIIYMLYNSWSKARKHFLGRTFSEQVPFGRLLDSSKKKYDRFAGFGSGVKGKHMVKSCQVCICLYFDYFGRLTCKPQWPREFSS